MFAFKFVVWSLAQMAIAGAAVWLVSSHAQLAIVAAILQGMFQTAALAVSEGIWALAPAAARTGTKRRYRPL